MKPEDLNGLLWRVEELLDEQEADVVHLHDEEGEPILVISRVQRVVGIKLDGGELEKAARELGIDLLPPETPPALRVEEAAKMLGIGRTAAYEAVRTGQIRSVRIGAGRGSIRVPRSAIEEMLA